MARLFLIHLAPAAGLGLKAFDHLNPVGGHMVQEERVMQIAIVGFDAKLASKLNRSIEGFDKGGGHNHSALDIEGVGFHAQVHGSAVDAEIGAVTHQNEGIDLGMLGQPSAKIGVEVRTERAFGNGYDLIVEGQGLERIDGFAFGGASDAVGREGRKLRRIGGMGVLSEDKIARTSRIGSGKQLGDRLA